MSAPVPAVDAILRALRRTHQVRDFTDEPVEERDLQAILEVARWTGSSKNRQPWTFLVLRDRAVRSRVAELAPSARHVAVAPVAVAIVMNGENAEWDAFDEGRVVERMLVAAEALGLGAGVGWALSKARPAVGEALGIEPPAFVRSFVSIGHPSEAARAPRSPRGTARRPLDELVRDARLA